MFEAMRLAAFVSRVFDKFFRVPGQTGDSGTGLGLAIVKGFDQP